MNLTLVVFHGPKPDLLIRLIQVLQAALRSELGSAFSAYGMEQVHATIIGLEGWRVDGAVINAQIAQAANEFSAMDLGGFFQFMLGLPSCHIRIGGFSPSSFFPFTSRGEHPYVRSFVIDGSSAVMMGWPVAGEAYPMTLDSLRRQCIRYNVLHKYHKKKEDIDNDFFLVLGRVKRERVSDKKIELAQETIRQLLVDRAPLDLSVQPEALTVVAYTDAQLPIASSRRYSLGEALARVEELKSLYGEYNTQG